MCANKAIKFGVGLLLGLSSAMAHADDWFDEFSVDFSGFVRAEGAYSTGDENPHNQGGNVFNNRRIAREAFAPPNLIPQVIGSLGIPLGDLLPLGDLTNWNTVGLGVLDSLSDGVLGLTDTQDMIRRGDEIPSTDNDWNLAYLRAEAEMNMRFTNNLRLVARARGIFDPVVYDEFDNADVRQFRGGITGGDPELYHGTPNYFEYRVEGDTIGSGVNGNDLEITGEDYMVDFPAFVLEYTNGPMTMRLGNQQIAWGQAIFFRVLDVPNGLDLRRHSLLDRGLEEFSDKRVPMLSARLTYQLSGNILADAYFGKFQPTVFGNPNTPYNIIPTQFTVHDRYKADGYDDEYSYGLRLKGDYGQWGWQAIYAKRWNPDGTFRWTQSGENKDLPNDPGSLGFLVNAAYMDSGCGPTTGSALAQTAFEASPGGVYSADEWFEYASRTKLAGVAGLNASIEEFPCAQDLFASPVDTMAEANAQLNTFFMAAGGALRGHIAREYHQEEVFGLGGSYVIESDTSDFLNQLILNLEVSYQPDRTFTNINLSRNYIVEDEWTAALVMDKWHRFSPSFPGTYIVAQVMYKTASDLFGRHLSGYGGSRTNGFPKGKDDATYVVFGFSQPFPNKIWEIEFASLYDPEGSVLLQPGVRWNPGNNITVEAFYNYINGALGSADPGDTLLSTVDFADELSLRLTYQF